MLTSAAFWSRTMSIYQAGDTIRLRASWGRYGQFQGINELQVEDGIDEFFPTQKADHAIVGLLDDRCHDGGAEALGHDLVLDHRPELRHRHPDHR